MNAHGEVIGLSTMLIGPGLGMAVPSNVVQAFLQRVTEAPLLGSIRNCEAVAWHYRPKQLHNSAHASKFRSREGMWVEAPLSRSLRHELTLAFAGSRSSF